MTAVLAIDIGGTKMAAAMVDAEGTVSSYFREPTPRSGNAESLWQRLESVLAKVLADAGVTPDGVGVGCSGPMTWPEGVVAPLNIVAWRDFPLRQRLREMFPNVPVRLHNDAVCVAIGEHWTGAGRGAHNVLGMVVSTGVGGGLLLGGRLIDGASGNAGHIGHVVVDPAGPDCACGGRGCIEAIASGPALVAWAQRQGWRADAEATGVELAADARGGEAIALAAMHRAGTALGIAIASAAHLCDLDTVVVGGGLSQTGALLFDPLERALRRHARMTFTRNVRVVPAQLGQRAGLVGAAALILRAGQYWSQTEEYLEVVQ
ncbi:ROK family protein [Nocardia sp. NPDC050712]|uniref:ROK family protein n=1 Tax=Nocardia sp. NPDC050712 TaxID=3155518 RepID=UPI0033CF7A4D